MTETLPHRPNVGAAFSERSPHTTAAASRQSSSYSHAPSHYRVGSQNSLIPASSRISKHGSRHSSRRVSTVHEDPQRPRHNRRLKSQYPLNSPEPHVAYILVASFDIDRGPIMEHQYPGAISPDEGMLAELMLPDQTHVRQQDWTMFFLHKDNPVNEEELAEKNMRREERRQQRHAREEALAQGLEVLEDGDIESSSDESDMDDPDETEIPPLMYVLNLVNTKQDSTVKRGAVVKAMAICTRHSFLHIYKPLLLLALEEYFKSPVPETLESLYNSLNDMDLSLMPRLSLLEKHILQASDAKDMFVEKFEKMISQRKNDDESTNTAEALDSPTKTLAKHAVPRDTHEFESKIVYHGISIPVKIPTALSPDTVGDFSLIKLIQTFGNSHLTQPQPFALHPHLTTGGAYTHPIIVLINAMLTQKRVIFLGHNQPSGEVAEAVLAACGLVSSGVLRGFTRHAFPYTDLTKIDELLRVPGFIAGVTNPAFAYHPEWWDLLCDIPTGRMKISPSIEPAPVTEGSTFFQQHTHSLLSSLQKDNGNSDASGDTQFMSEISRSIASRHGESIIRAKFRAYIIKFTRIAAAFEETVYGATALSVISPAELDQATSPRGTIGSQLRPVSSKTSRPEPKGHGYVWPTEEAKNREMAASAARIEGWKNTRSYHAFVQDLATRSRVPPSPTTPVAPPDASSKSISKQNVDLYHMLSKLRTLKLLPAEAGAIYMTLEAYCDDYKSILELLELTPMSEAGLFFISLGLWHENLAVREAVAQLLDRVRNHAAGRIFFARLGGWVHVGFNRCLHEREARLNGKRADLDDIVSLVTTNGETRGS